MLSHSFDGLSLSLISKSLDPVSSGPVTPMSHGSSFAQSIIPTHTLAQPPADLDVLIVPGGPGARANETELQPYFDFIKQQYPNLKYLISVCTGSTFLARAGVLDGRKATSNKFSWKFGTGTGPNVNWVPEVCLGVASSLPASLLTHLFCRPAGLWTVISGRPVVLLREWMAFSPGSPCSGAKTRHLALPTSSNMSARWTRASTPLRPCGMSLSRQLRAHRHRALSLQLRPRRNVRRSQQLAVAASNC